MNQSSTNNPDEFMKKQLEILREINTNEVKELQIDLKEKAKKVQTLTEELNYMKVKLDKYENESTHKNKDMQLTIRELELNMKILEEDKERMQCENTLLVEELLAKNKANDKSMQQVIDISFDKLNQQDHLYECHETKVRQTSINNLFSHVQNEEYIEIIRKLTNKSNKLKSNLQNVESTHNHNIMILHTQFEKQYNKWEQERVGYQQDIHTLKRKLIDLHHLIRKYQHDSALASNTSLWSCS